MDRRSLLFIVSLTLSFILVRTFFEQEEPKKSPTQTAAQVVHEKEAQFESETFEEKPQEFYVLENEYLQLVFSNLGGSLTEINLPFKNKAHPKSVVLPIEVDKELVTISPENARFPLFPSKDFQGNVIEGTLGGYYPLIRRDLIGKDPNDVPPRYSALNIVSEYPELAKLPYEVISFTEDEIVFQAKQPHRRITKRFSFPKNADDLPYCFLLDIKIEGPTQGLYLTSGVPEIEWMSGASAATIKYRTSRGKKYEVIKVDLPEKHFTLSSIYPDWVVNSNGFFGIIMDPLKGQEAGFKVERIPEKIEPTRLELIDPSFRRYGEEETVGYNILLPIKTVQGEMRVRLFTGPFSEKILTTVDDTYASEDNGKAADYISCQTYHGYFAFISEPFAKFLFFLMKICHSVTGSWGLSIIFATIVLRLLLYPLNTWSIRSMKGMQEIGPEVKAIQDRYKKEPQKAQLEIMQLYRSKGINPVSGCLPMLLQIPFLIGMFDLLKSTYELRGVAFIPGWIDDLTSPDVVFQWDFYIPFIGNELHLLPVFLGAIMYVQQNVMSNLPKDPAQWTDQQKQSRNMGNIMTVVMTVLFYHFPSGLNLYWISSMLLGIVQQWWINRSTPQGIPSVIEVKPNEVQPADKKSKKKHK